jgi:hypothetical protein
MVELFSEVVKLSGEVLGLFLGEFEGQRKLLGLFLQVGGLLGEVGVLLLEGGQLCAEVVGVLG